MNTGKASITILCLAGALAAANVQAQQVNAQRQAKAPLPSTMPTPQMGQATPDILFSQMHGEQVKSASGRKIASLQDLVINPNTGRIRFAVLGRGGFFGLGQKLLPVPWQKVTQTSNKQLAVNITQRKLDAAPQIAGNYSNLNTPGFLYRIDQYYSVSPSAVGGAQAPSGTQHGTSSKSWNQGHKEQGTSGHQGRQNQPK